MSLVLPPPLPPWRPLRGPSVCSPASVLAVPPDQRHGRQAARGTALQAALPPEPLARLFRRPQSVSGSSPPPHTSAGAFESGTDTITSGSVTTREPPRSSDEGQPSATLRLDDLSVSVSYAYDVTDLCVVRVDGTLSGARAGQPQATDEVKRPTLAGMSARHP